MQIAENENIKELRHTSGRLHRLVQFGSYMLGAHLEGTSNHKSVDSDIDIACCVSQQIDLKRHFLQLLPQKLREFK